MSVPATPQLVQDSASLEALVEGLRSNGSFAFDTEFVGEENYTPQICLVQVATDQFCALIDPLSPIDLSPFWKLIIDPQIQVIVHAGSEDIGLCFRETGSLPANLIDLQIAAGMVGLGYPASLAKLARATVDVVVHKSQTLTDWRRRPLTREQIEYAAADVVYLPEMFGVIRKTLIECGREKWAYEESMQLCESMKHALNPDNRKQRLRGGGGLNRREWAVAEALMDERDKLAREYNRPPRSMLKDYLLVELARRGWTDPSKMAGLRGLSLTQAALKRLANAIEEAKKMPLSDAPRTTADPDRPDEEVLISYLNAVLRDHCLKEQISYSLLVNRQDLRDYVRTFTRQDEPSATVSLHSGWRLEAVGDLLDRLMTGAARTRVTHEKGQLILQHE